MTPVALFETIDIFSSKTRICHHVQIELRGTDHAQVRFTVRRLRGGFTSLVFDEKLHGRTRAFDMLERVTSHTMWHSWAIESIAERGLDDSVTQATLGMVDIRHMGLPFDLQPE